MVPVEDLSSSRTDRFREVPNPRCSIANPHNGSRASPILDIEYRLHLFRESIEVSQIRDVSRPCDRASLARSTGHMCVASKDHAKLDLVPLARLHREVTAIH